MQLNGIVHTMAASEPPEPPPRNPDKINASLKQFTDSKTTKSLDNSGDNKLANSNGTSHNKIIKQNISLDASATNTATAAAATPIISAAVTGGPTAATTLAGVATATPVVSYNPTIIKKIDTNCLIGGGQGNPTAASTAPADIDTKSITANDNSHVVKNKGISSEILNGSGGGNKSQNDLQANNNKNINLNNCNNNIIESCQSLKQNMDNNIDNSSSAVVLSLAKDRRDEGPKGSTIDLESPQTTKIRLENERLTAEINRLKKLLELSPDGAVGGIELGDNISFGAQSGEDNFCKMERLENELKIAKELIQSLKAERKKLRSDKSDLLCQVKQLCSSLQDKEQELRNFIRTFEQRVKDTESSAAKMTTDRERERWSLLKHARDESERSMQLAAQLNARDIQLQRTQEQLQDARRQLSGCMSDQESLVSLAPLTPPSGLMSHMVGQQNPYSNISGTPGDRGSCSADSGVRGSSDRESAAGDLNLSDGACDNGPCITIDSDSISLVSSHHNMYQYGTPKERSPTLSPLNTGAFSKSVDNGALSRSVEQLGSPVDTEGPPIMRRLPSKLGTALSRTGRGGTWGSISRVFARTRNRNKNNTSNETEAPEFQWSPLTEEGYAEKLRLLREASSMPIERWRSSQIIAWLEVALGMPQYSSRCAENVKSGKVLLELSDAELETGLGTTHPMHRKKLRLAIEEQRRPDLIRYPTIGQLGHTWVASEWIQDIGLPQYAESFLHSLVDARMLDTLSKKELEKYLGVTRKFHQASIVHGIHVLRILKYDRQGLSLRRLQSDNEDSDPIVWTNSRLIRWVRTIDLGEYADNLKDSGVHGGLIVLEPSFSGDTMATALGIPPNKNIIRRHLATEFEALVLPARATLGQGIRSGRNVVPITGPNGLTNDQRYRTNGSLRGSLSKTFRLSGTTKSKQERREGSYTNSTSPTPSELYSSSSEGGIYATIGAEHLITMAPHPPPVPLNPPPSYRVSAPPFDTNSTLPRYAEHRRVKSISDIEIVTNPSS